MKNEQTKVPQRKVSHVEVSETNDIELNRISMIRNVSFDSFSKQKDEPINDSCIEIH